MKEIKTLADLEEASSTECAIWVGKKLFRLREEYQSHVGGEDIHGYAFFEPGFSYSTWMTIYNYLQWFYSLEGIDALKREMVRRGYMWESCYVDDGNTTFYKTEFHHKEKDSYGISVGDSEIEATWKAAAMALLGE